MSKIKNDPIWHRMLYSCTHMVTAGIKGLIMTKCLHALPLLFKAATIYYENSSF